MKNKNSSLLVNYFLFQRQTKNESIKFDEKIYSKKQQNETLELSSNWNWIDVEQIVIKF